MMGDVKYLLAGGTFLKHFKQAGNRAKTLGQTVTYKAEYHLQDIKLQEKEDKEEKHVGKLVKRPQR